MFASMGKLIEVCVWDQERSALVFDSIREETIYNFSSFPKWRSAFATLLFPFRKTHYDCVITNSNANFPIEINQALHVITWRQSTQLEFSSYPMLCSSSLLTGMQCTVSLKMSECSFEINVLLT